MRYITIFIVLFFTTGLFAQTDKSSIDSKDFVSKRIKIYEPNPIHKDLSDSIDKRFHKTLISFPDCKLDTNLLIKLLIDNSVTSYEDSQERYRYSVRRSMIFSIFAMTLPSDKANLYIDFAEKSLLNSENRIEPNLIENYSGLLILDLIIKDSNKTLNSFDICGIKDKFKTLETLIDKQIYMQGLKIIETIEMKIKK